MDKTANERIKELRKILKLSQNEFAEKINISRSNICNIEIGRVIATERVIQSICSAFNVHSEWIKHGTGDMYQKSDKSIIDNFAQAYKLSERDKELLTIFATEFDDEERKIFYDLASKMKPPK